LNKSKVFLRVNRVDAAVCALALEVTVSDLHEAAWSNGQGGGFSLTGEFVSLTPFSRIEHVERMHLPATTPDNHIVTTFAPDGDGTVMTMRMELPNEAARTAMMASGFDKGMEVSYARLEKMIQARSI